MTMDISNRKSEIQLSDDQTKINAVKVTKRPFDVAFLMLPDEKLKQKQNKKSIGKFETIYSTITNTTNNNTNNNNNNNNELSVDEDDEEIEVGNNQDFKINSHNKYIQTQKQQIFDDPNLIKSKHLDHFKASLSTFSEKSAFTKVNLPSLNTNLSKNLRLSPNLSISPDLTYQSSLSPSPPIINRSYQSPLLSPNQLFKQHHHQQHQHQQQQQQQAYQNQYIQTDGFSQSTFHPKINPYSSSYNYQHFQSQDILKISPATGAPAAAILSSLLPPSLAALSLPAQNVCAKCNISFRMTSDLVYHMRSHHKNDSVDLHKRRREEKLKCPVCAESFRERHHLTRHMTAHQDKDDDDNDIKKKSV